MLKPEDKKLLGKRKCRCGRRIIVKRLSDGSISKDEVVCKTCETLGLEKSRILFLQINAKSKNTKYN